LSALLSTAGIGISFGGVRAVEDVSFSVNPGEIFSVIGPNGAGKTTLFNLVSGVYAANAGSVSLNGETVTGLPPEKLAAKGLSRTFQNLQIFFRMTALENVMLGRHVHESKSVLQHLLGLPATQRQNRETRDRAMELLKRQKLDHVAHATAGSLPYGILKRLEIARALASEPKVLLLDEPAAGCNPTETAEIDHLIVEVAKSGISVVLVEHDMKLVMAISDRVHVMAQGRTLMEGKPHEVANDQRVIEAYLGSGLPGVEHGLEQADA
jgi:branched-chain amino acid transport system ATP-binding protein